MSMETIDSIVHREITHRRHNWIFVTALTIALAVDLAGLLAAM